MSDRADILGALLEGGGVYDQMLSSRRSVGAKLAAEQKKLGSEPKPGDFNSKHPRGGKGSAQGGKFIAKGSSGAPVQRVQKRLGVAQTGHFAFDTEAAVRNFQRQHGLAVDGIVGAQTAQALLGNRNAKAVTPGALLARDASALGVQSGKAKRSTRAPKAKAPAPVSRFGGGTVV